ncbi:MAG: hypothetical protein WCW44_04785, partial [archaeon]
EKTLNKKFPIPQLLVLGAIVLISLFFVFPMLTNSGSGLPQVKNVTPQVASASSGIGVQNLSLEGNFKTITIQVQIPCGGHTSLILSEVKKLNGVNSITPSNWNTFQITFNPTKITQEHILAAGVFQSYPAKLVN